MSPGFGQHLQAGSNRECLWFTKVMRKRKGFHPLPRSPPWSGESGREGRRPGASEVKLAQLETVREVEQGVGGRLGTKDAWGGHPERRRSAPHLSGLPPHLCKAGSHTCLRRLLWGGGREEGGGRRGTSPAYTGHSLCPAGRPCASSLCQSQHIVRGESQPLCARPPSTKRARKWSSPHRASRGLSVR